MMQRILPQPILGLSESTSRYKFLSRKKTTATSNTSFDVITLDDSDNEDGMTLQSNLSSSKRKLPNDSDTNTGVQAESPIEFHSELTTLRATVPKSGGASDSKNKKMKLNNRVSTGGGSVSFHCTWPDCGFVTNTAARHLKRHVTIKHLKNHPDKSLQSANYLKVVTTDVSAAATANAAAAVPTTSKNSSTAVASPSKRSMILKNAQKRISLMSSTPSASSSSTQSAADIDLRCKFPLCQAVLSSESRLKAHNRLHLCIKPYRCLWPNCTHACELKSDMKEHIRGHFDEEATGSIGGDERNPKQYIQVIKELL